MSAAPIYVVVSSDDLNRKWLDEAKARDPDRKPNPIIWETNVNGATLESATAMAARRESEGYGPCRVARLVFEDEPGFHERRDICGEGGCCYFGQKRPSTCACSKVTP